MEMTLCNFLALFAPVIRAARKVLDRAERLPIFYASVNPTTP